MSTFKKIKLKGYYAAVWCRRFAMSIYGYIRSLKPVSAIFGPLFERSRDCIEIDITYACSLACYNCNRSVRQAPSSEGLNTDQIRKFVSESISGNKKWRRIRLLGGEPMIHPKIFEVLDILLEYKREFSADTEIAVHTNGYGKAVEKRLPLVPDDVVIVNTSKESDVNWFYPFNMAPRDSAFYKFADYSVGCRVPLECGIGLTPYGYYPCAAAGSIDRVLGLNIARDKLPDDDDDMRDQMKKLCEYCGSFKMGGITMFGQVDYEVASPSWDVAYEKWRKEKPKMSVY